MLGVTVSTNTRIFGKVDPSVLSGGAKRIAALGYVSLSEESWSTFRLGSE